MLKPRQWALWCALMLAPAAALAAPVQYQGANPPFPVDVSAATPLPVTASPSSASAAGIAPVVSAAAEACHVLKAGAGNLYGVSGNIGAAGFIMVFNATSAPSDGAVTPVVWAQTLAGGAFAIDYGAVPLYLGTGITVCASSTGPLTKTAYSTNVVFSGRVQ